jgi:hypothetical protein
MVTGLLEGRELKIRLRSSWDPLVLRCLLDPCDIDVPLVSDSLVNSYLQDDRIS